MKSKTESAGATAQRKANADKAVQGSDDAVALLTQDHREVSGLFEQYASVVQEDQKSGLVEQICNALVIHTHLEEEIFYPACREAGVDMATIDRAQVEHDAISLFILDLKAKSPQAPFYDAKVQVLGEYVELHVREEEDPSGGIFAKARQADMDLVEVGNRLLARKQQLEAVIETRAISPSAPRTLEPRQTHAGDNTMARYDQERDEQGRFVSDHDRGGYRQGRYGEDDRRYGRSRYEEEDRGRYPRSDSDYRTSGRGHGGWYGDYEGHSRASERGWEARRAEYDDDRGRYGRARYDEDDRGRYSSRYDEGDRGRYSRSRADENDRGARMGHGGWYGDPEGHSRVSELGWDHRRGESDDGRYGRSRADEGDRSASRGGHGGWYGDPEGHAEAARRGWQGR